MNTHIKIVCLAVILLMNATYLTVSAQTLETGVYYTGSPNIACSATDASGNIFVAGFYAGSIYSTYDLDPGPLTVSPREDATDSYSDSFVAKYSSSGTLLWSASAITESNCNNLVIKKMVTDASGNLFIMGNVWGLYAQFWDDNSLLQLDGANFSSGFQARPFVVKMSSEGELQWAYSYYANNEYNYLGNDLALDASGNVFIAGVYSQASNQATIWKLNSSGVFQSLSYLGAGSEAYGLAIDGSSNIYLSGVAYGTVDMDPSGTTNNLSANADGDAFLAKYNSSVAYQWAERLTTTATKETGEGVVYDGSGNLFVIVDAGSTLSLFKRTSAGAASTSISLTTSGTTFDPRYLEINSSNEIFASGVLNGTADFDPGAGASSQTGGNYIVKYSNALAFSYRIAAGPGLALTAGDKVVVGTNTGTTVYTEGTADVTNPAVSSYSPADNGFAGVNNDLVMTFSEDVVPVNGSTLSIKRTADQSVFATYTLPSANVTVVANSVTINPTSSLLNGIGYYVNVDAGAFKDLVGRNYAGIATTSTWNFTATSDVTSPEVSSFSPLDNATDVDITSNLVITFDETVTAVATKVVTIKTTSGDAVFESYTLPSGNVMVSGATVTINPTASFANLTGYYVDIDEGAFKDAVNNDFAGIATNSGWNFTTISTDPTPPDLSSLSPTHNASGVAVNANLTATFSENVVAVSSKVVTIKRTSDNAVFESYTLPSANIEVSGATVTINPTGSFTNSIGYYVYMDAGAFEDAAGNDFAGIAGSGTWNFLVEASDLTPPTISTLSPVNFASNVPLNANLVATFSEAMTAVATKVIAIVKSSDLSLVESFTLPSGKVSVSGSMVTIDPTDDFLNSTSYYVVIANDALTDGGGNPFAGIMDNVTWTFTTEAPPDETSPTLLTLSPSDNASGVAVDVNLVATFSEDVTAVASKLVSIKQVSDNGVFESYTLPHANVSVSGTTVTIDPGGTLSNAVDYYVSMDDGAFEDAAGNDFAGIANSTDWNFTTAAAADGTPPTVASLSPADNATGVAVNSNLVVTFSEDIVAGTGLIVIRQLSDNSIISSTGVGSAQISGNTMTIDPADLEPGIEYYVDLAVGLVKDATGNEFAGLNGNPDWTFTTVIEDNTAPVLTASVPDYNFATDVNINTPFSLTFSEAVVPGAGYVRLVVDGLDYIVIDPADMDQSGNTFSYTLPIALPYSKTVVVFIEQDAFHDLAENPYSNPGNDPNYSFETEAAPDETPPQITSFSPANNATDVALDASLVMTFDEPIVLGNNGSSPWVLIWGVPGGNAPILLNDAEVTTISGNTVTMNYPGGFQNGVTYYITLGEGVLEDAADNWVVGWSNSTTWTFTTFIDTTAPVITASVPDFNFATNVGINTPFGLTFSEAVIPGPGTVRLVVNGSDYLVIDPDNMEQSGNSFTYTLPDALPYSKTVIVIIEHDAFRDLAGNPYANPNNDPNYSFETEAAPDGTPPQITSFSPANNATGVALDAPLVMTFDEPVRLATNGATKWAILWGGPEVNSVIDLTNSSVTTISGNTITMQPGTLQESTTYYITLADDIVEDFSSNWMPGWTGGTTWRFTTVDVTPPQIVSVSPAHEATDVSINTTFTITYSEPVVPNTDGFPFVRLYIWPNQVEQVQLDNAEQVTIDGSTITISFNNPLQYGTSYLLGTFNQMVKDLAGNVNSENPNFQFKTAKGDQTIAFAALDAMTFGDAPFDLAASASSGLPVTYASSNTNVATVSGSTVTIAGAGSTTITASQGGNSTYNAATSVEQVLIVSKANQAITFSDIPGKTLGDADFTLEASASSGMAVSFSSSNTDVAAINGSSVAIVGGGSAVITATQAGDDNYNAALPVERTLVVSDPNRQDQTIAFESLPVKTFGDEAFDLMATATSGLAVTFSSANTAIATVSGQTVTIVGAGSVVITANQEGDATYNPALAVHQTLTVNKADQTITFASPGARTYGDPGFSLDASSSSGLAVEFESSNVAVAIVNGSDVAIVGAGSATITAVQGGDANHNPATPVEHVLTVSKADQAISFGSLTDVIVGAPPFTLDATASSGLAVSYVSSNPAVATISDNTVTVVGQGTTSITASQAGNENYNEATPVSQTLRVNTEGLESQTITFDVLETKTFGDADFSVTATASSGLTVSLASSDVSVATISGNTVTIVGAGSTVITASQDGNAVFNPAPSVERTLTVNKADQTITFTPFAEKMVGDESFELTASATSGLAISFSSSDLAVATVSGGTVAILDAGTTVITASQAGNNNYNAASAVQQTLTVIPQTRIIGLSGTMAFGDLIVPETATNVLTISNTGNSLLTITNIIYPAGYSGNKTNGTVAVGGSLVVSVTLTPVEPRDYSGSIEVISDATSGTSTIDVTGRGVKVTGLEPSFADHSLKVFPNPGAGIFTIDVFRPKTNTIMLCDQMGRLAETVVIEPDGEGRYRFNISHHAQGVYFVSIQTDYGVKMTRLVKVN
jgi:hypothetical protein